MKYTHSILFFAILFASVALGSVYAAENLDDFHKQFSALAEKLDDEEESSDAYDALVELLIKDEDTTIAFLSQCAESELLNVEMVFSEVAFELKSPKLLKCVWQLDEKYPYAYLGSMVFEAVEALKDAKPITPEAFEELRKKADQNDPDALYKLVICYYTGNGTKQNYDAAFKLARQAEEAGLDFAKDLLDLPVIDTMDKASKGDPLNMYHMGLIHEKGLYGFAQDSKKAIEWYLKAARAGVAEAQFEYGWYCENLGGNPKNLKTAHDWYLLAANQGHAEAQYRLGIFYGTGEKGIPWNPTKAVEWYRKAAEQGHPIAQHNYGTYIHFPEYGGGLGGGYAEAKKWYQKAADQGFEWAEMKARIPYGAPGFFEEADRIMKKMAEQGVVAAIAHCAWRAETTGNVKEAFQYYLIGEKAGSVSALNGLGNCYRYGWGTPRDEEKAVQYYRKAAEKGSIPALINLSECYSTGCGVEKDEAAAEEWKTKIENIGPDAMNELAYCYLYGGKGVKHDGKKAIEWFEKASEHGHAFASYQLAFLYWEGQAVEKDNKKAYEWCTKAAEQGLVEAQYRLAIDYYDGKKIEQDYKKAVEWFTKAAEQGFEVAQFNLAVIYSDGKVVKRDAEKAVEWFTKSAKQGNVIAQCNVGVFYFNGDGVEKNYELAVEWFTKAAEQGNAEAQFNLGYCYEMGVVGDPDSKKAIEWYTKAAAQGDARAKERLESLKKEQ